MFPLTESWGHPMTITIAEYENIKKSMEFLAQLRSIPVELIKFYLENEHGYIVREPKSSKEKTDDPDQ